MQSMQRNVISTRGTMFETNNLIPWQFLHLGLSMANAHFLQVYLFPFASMSVLLPHFGHLINRFQSSILSGLGMNSVEGIRSKKRDFLMIYQVVISLKIICLEKLFKKSGVHDQLSHARSIRFFLLTTMRPPAIRKTTALTATTPR